MDKYEYGENVCVILGDENNIPWSLVRTLDTEKIGKLFSIFAIIGS